MKLTTKMNIIAGDGLIPTKSNTGEVIWYIKEHSNLYSGMTGQLLARVRSRIKLPCSRALLFKQIQMEVGMIKKLNYIYESDGEGGILADGIKFEAEAPGFLPLSILTQEKIELTWRQKLSRLLLIWKQKFLGTASNKSPKILKGRTI